MLLSLLYVLGLILSYSSFNFSWLFLSPTSFWYFFTYFTFVIILTMFIYFDMILIWFDLRYWFLSSDCTWVMRSLLYNMIFVLFFLFLWILCFDILWPFFNAFLLMLVWDHWLLLLCLIFVITSIIWLTFVVRSWDTASLTASIFYSALYLDRSFLIFNWGFYLLPLNWFICFFEWILICFWYVWYGDISLALLFWDILWWFYWSYSFLFLRPFNLHNTFFFRG